MKKIFILCTSLLLLACGCGKMDINKAKDEFKNTVNSSKAYELKGTMEIYNNEDTFKYDLTVNYEKDDKYKVSMVNKNNNHEQIILKNDEGVYVVTPSLNKSFKFESEWPDNSSQAYILSSILNDMNNDPQATFKEEQNGYVIEVKVNYPHNKSLVCQNLYFDKDMNLERIEVFDKDKNKKMVVEINSIDYKAKYKDDYFDLDNYIEQKEEPEGEEIETKDTKKENTTKSNNSTSNTNNTSSNKENTTDSNKQNNDNTQNSEQQTTGVLDDIIYPLYVPTNTYLKSKDKISNEQTDRTILTFNGDKSFILVEEAATVSKEFEVIPVNGDPLFLTDSVAALSDNSLSWTANNVDYYLTSNNLSTDEMMTIAQSMGTTALGK